MNKSLSKITILIVILYTIVNVFFISKLKLEYDFESFFPEKDKDFAFFKDYAEKFGNDNDWLVIGLKNKDQSIFNEKSLQEIENITLKLKNIPNVDSIQSPTNIQNVLISPFGIVKIPFLHISNHAVIKKDSALIYSYPELISTLFAKDAKSVCLLLHFKTKLKKDESKELHDSILKVIKNSSFQETYLAGRLHAEVEYIERMGFELIIFVSSSIILIIFFLYISFRSAWGVVLPLFIVIISIIACIGFMAMNGKNLDIMTILIPTIMFVVGMSDVIHILSKYLEELRYGNDKTSAIKKTMKEVGLATFLTSLTTAIGFLTLLTAGIRPIREFGVYTAVGVILAFVLAITFLPALLYFLEKPKIVNTQNEKLFWYKWLHNLLLNIIKRRKIILIGTILLSLLSIYGISKIEINVKLIDEVNEGDPLKEDFLFFEKSFGGGRPFEFTIWLKDSTKTMLDEPVLADLNKIQNYLELKFNVKQIFSPISVIKSMNRSMHAGLPIFYTLPSDSIESKKISRILKIASNSNALKNLITSNKLQARFTGKIADIGSKYMLQKTDSMYLFLDQNLDPAIYGYKITGSAALIDKTNFYLSKNMLEGLLIAFVAIAIIMSLLFRSPRIILVSLIPNIIPLLFIGGLIGFWGIGLKMSTSIIFTIAFGIAVDDTIHFLSKLKIELSKGKNLLYAIKRTFISTGKAIILTSIILSGGFLTLILSSFNGTFYTGLLISLTLIFAVLADLLLIPVLLFVLYPPSKHKRIIKK